VKTEPLCSVLITVKDLGQLAAQAVESVIDQRRPGDEIVVVDDGSTDDTAVILHERYGKAIVLIRLQESLGSAGARNIAGTAATNELLVFLDGDDLALPGRLDAHRSAARAGDVSYGRLALIDDRGRLLTWHRGLAIRSQVPLQRQIRYESPIPFSAAAIKRDAFESLGGFTPTLLSSEDWDFWYRAVKAGQSFWFIDEHLTSYRLRTSSKTADFEAKKAAYAAVRASIRDDTQLASERRYDDLAFRRREVMTLTMTAWRQGRLGRRASYLRVVEYLIRWITRELQFRLYTRIHPQLRHPDPSLVDMSTAPRNLDSCAD
jgi:glycosyltransferase involved in cell wall biosynthesis